MMGVSFPNCIEGLFELMNEPFFEQAAEQLYNGI